MSYRVCYVVVCYDAISCLLCSSLLLCHIMFVMLLSAMMPYRVCYVVVWYDAISCLSCCCLL